MYFSSSVIILQTKLLILLQQPKELFTIRQRQTPTQTRGVIILTGELDFETQSMYTLTMYATVRVEDLNKNTFTFDKDVKRHTLFIRIPIQSQGKTLEILQV